MEIINNFFKTIGKSIYGPDFYKKELIAKPFFKSFKYFVSLVIIISLFKIVFIFSPFLYSYFFLDQNNGGFKGFCQQIINLYPDELEIKVVNGIATSNVAEPYFIKNSLTKENFDNLIVINTKQESFSIDDLNKYKTISLLIKDSFIFQNKDGQIKIQPIEPNTNFTLNKKIVEDFGNKVIPWLSPLIVILTIIITLFIILFIFLQNVIYLLIIALIIYLLNKGIGGYKKAYQASLHLATLPLIISILPIETFKFFPTVCIFILAAINLSNESIIKINKKA